MPTPTSRRTSHQRCQQQRRSESPLNTKAALVAREEAADDATDTDDEAADVCRICLKSAAGGRLLRLCRCAGSVAFTHAHCLTRWLNSSMAETCELCGCRYPLRVTRQPDSCAHYLTHLLLDRRRKLAVDVAYSLLLFSPGAAFLLLQLRLLQGDCGGGGGGGDGGVAGGGDSGGRTFDTAAAIACGLLLLLLTSVTWLVTVFAEHRQAFLAWQRRRLRLALVLQQRENRGNSAQRAASDGEIAKLH